MATFVVETLDKVDSAIEGYAESVFADFGGAVSGLMREWAMRRSTWHLRRHDADKPVADAVGFLVRCDLAPADESEVSGPLRDATTQPVRSLRRRDGEGADN